jgi:hypothetical protein
MHPKGGDASDFHAQFRKMLWPRWVTISISPAAVGAFAAIVSVLPKGSTAPTRPDGNGGYLVTLDRPVLDRLAAMRRPGESYSDVILRLAVGERPGGNVGGN